MMPSVSTIFFALRPIVVGLEREELSEIIIQPMLLPPLSPTDCGPRTTYLALRLISSPSSVVLSRVRLAQHSSGGPEGPFMMAIG